MKQEFITSKGKIAISRNTIYIKKWKSSFEESLVGRLLFPFAFLFATVIKFIQPDEPMDYFGVVVFGILFLFYADRIYDVLIKRSIANRITLERIRFYEVKPDDLLETEIILHLKNGRYRSVLFRTLEKQYEPFIEAISQHSIQPQPA